MLDHDFYAEPAGTVCAVHRSDRTTTGHRPALVTVADHPAGLTWAAVSDAYLRTCRRVSPDAARALHPELLRRLTRDLTA